MAELARSRQLREKRANLVDLNRQVLEKIESETNQARVRELETEWDARDGEIVSLTGQIKRAERQDEIESDLDSARDERRGGREMPIAGPMDPEKAQKTYRSAFSNWLRGGNEGIEQRERQILRGGHRSLDADERIESRTGQTVTTTGGGYLIPQDFQREIETSMLDYSGVLSAPTRKLRTDTGATLPWPTVDDTSNVGQLLSINTQDTEQAVTYGVVNFGAYKFTSKQVLVPLELLQDSAFDMDAHLRELLAERVGRVLEQYFTTGTGSSQPQGIVVGAGSGTVLNGTAYVAAIAYTDLVDLQHSVDRSYRKGAAWMFNDSTLKTIKKMVDSQNRPLWAPGVASREPDTILGDPYFINQQMAPMGGGNKSMIYGNLAKYVVRIVKDMTLVRFNERYMDYYQIGFQLFMRADGRLLDAGTDPIKYLQHPTA